MMRERSWGWANIRELLKIVRLSEEIAHSQLSEEELTCMPNKTNIRLGSPNIRLNTKGRESGEGPGMSVAPAKKAKNFGKTWGKLIAYCKALPASHHHRVVAGVRRLRLQYYRAEQAERESQTSSRRVWGAEP